MFDFLRKMMGPVDRIDITEVLKRDPMILDVRSPFEYEQGHIRGSVNIPINELRRNVPDIRNHLKPVIAVCRTGIRSKMAVHILREAGVEVYNGGSWDVIGQVELLQ